MSMPKAPCGTGWKQVSLSSALAAQARPGGAASPGAGAGRCRGLPLALSTAALALSMLVGVVAVLGHGARAGTAGTLYVAPEGACGGGSPCYATVQAAADAAADGDAILVAQGVYTSASLEVVYIDKALSITGGFAVDDWEHSYPVTRPTVLDAQNMEGRRVVRVQGSGNGVVTLAALTIQGGVADSSDGGGVYVVTGTVVLERNRIAGNTASRFGGGVCVERGSATLISNTLTGNVADYGGALSAQGRPLVVEGNVFEDNTGGYGGGALYVYLLNGAGSGEISRNTFQGNSAGRGGAIYLHSFPVLVSSNSFLSNAATWGGGLWMPNGKAAIDGNLFEGNDSSGGYGGAICTGNDMALPVVITVTNNRLIRNVANAGGAADLKNATGTFTGNIVRHNRGTAGGGVYLYSAAVAFEDNTIQENVSSGDGGGILAYKDRGSSVDSSTIISNTAAGRGGGVFAEVGDLRFRRNLLRGNVASGTGGGLYVRGKATLDANTIVQNHAGSFGGGIASESGAVSASNDLVAGNQSAREGVYIFAGATLTARHWTLADNGGFALTTNGASAWLTNTIVVSHTVGGLAGTGISADHTLFSATGTPCGSGASCAESVYGEPEFVDPNALDYHLGSGSAAVDAGVDAGVTVDMDGDPRPVGSGYDIGADERMPLPSASFAYSGPRWTGQTIAFSSTSVVTGSASYQWQFGDGVSATTPNPTHVYAAPGVYTVTLTATNSAGSDTAANQVRIGEASFHSEGSGWIGRTVVFTNTSVCHEAASFLWEFGDGAVSTAENGTHTYSAAGVYTTTLTATDTSGSGLARAAMIIYSKPLAAFTASPTAGIRPLSVDFTNNTTTIPAGDGTVVYDWGFGDGERSWLRSPTHVYEQAGTYTVTLAAGNAAGEDVLTRTAYIEVQPIPVQASFSHSPAPEVAPLAVRFGNTSAGDYASCEWDFGEGTTSTLESPLHIFPTEGTYAVTLSVSGSGGSDAVTMDVAVTPTFAVHLPLVLRNR